MGINTVFLFALQLDSLLQIGGIGKNPLAGLAALGLGGLAPANTGGLNPAGRNQTTYTTFSLHYHQLS